MKLKSILGSSGQERGKSDYETAITIWAALYGRIFDVSVIRPEDRSDASLRNADYHLQDHSCYLETVQNCQIRLDQRFVLPERDWSPRVETHPYRHCLKPRKQRRNHVNQIFITTNCWQRFRRGLFIGADPGIGWRDGETN